MANPALANYQTNQNSAASSPALDTLIANPQSVLQNEFFQTPAYQLLYGQNATQPNPVDRFHFDPGYQFAVNEGLQQLQNQGSAKGILDSGSMTRAMLGYAQGTADQNYQRFLGQQGGLFSDYQNRLANLTQMGASNTGSQNAMNLGMAQNANYGTQAAGTLSTGNDISSLFANQGTFGGNAMMSTGAAQASNLMQGAELQTQIDAANQASQAKSQGSLFSGLGSMFGQRPGTR